MKINKTFRLSEEAINILKEQESPTNFIEDLILQKDQRNAHNAQPRGSTGLNEATVQRMIDISIQNLLDKYDIKPKPVKGKYCPHGFMWGADEC